MSTSYSSLNQFEIIGIYIFRDGWNEKVKISDMLAELVLYEDIFKPSISATMLLVDMGNMPDNFPIVGGEVIEIVYKTPKNDTMETLIFSVVKVGRRNRDMTHNNYQGTELHMVTLDRILDLNIDLGKGYKGSYSAIVKSLLGELKTKKTLNSDSTIFNQNFIAPNWSPLKCCHEIAKRSLGAGFEPFLFYETSSAYNFKSVSSLFKADAYAILKIEPSMLSTDNTNPDRKYRRIIRYEYMESSDRPRQYDENVFGEIAMIFDPLTKRKTKQKYDYTSVGRGISKIDSFPIVDNMRDNRDTHGLIMTRTDKSHQGYHYRKLVTNLIDEYRIKVQVAGDQGYEVGQIVNLEIPDRSVSDYVKEQTTSGRWLIASLKHVINRDAFHTYLELVKDSHNVDIFAKVHKGKFDYDKERAASTGTGEPEQPTSASDE